MMNRKITMDGIEAYRIEVEGQLAAHLLAEFGAARRVDQSEGLTTTFWCDTEQAGLHGVLRWLYSLGLALRSVNLVEQRPDL